MHSNQYRDLSLELNLPFTLLFAFFGGVASYDLIIRGQEAATLGRCATSALGICWSLFSLSIWLEGKQLKSQWLAGATFLTASATFISSSAGLFAAISLVRETGLTIGIEFDRIASHTSSPKQALLLYFLPLLFVILTGASLYISGSTASNRLIWLRNKPSPSDQRGSRP